jgi:hypothetical protein
VQLLRTPFDLTTPVDISMDDGEASLAQTNEDGEASNLYTRLKENPRKRTDSAVTRTPWVKPFPKQRKLKSEEV